MSMLTELKATIAKHGSVARTNRFKVDFSGMNKLPWTTAENLRDFEYFLEDVTAPGKDLETTDYSPYRNLIAYATGYKNGDFSMKFRAPSDMFVKRIFDRWLDFIIPSDSYLLKYRAEIGVDFTIIQKTERENNKFSEYGVKIFDAYPIAISGIEYSVTQNDEYVTFNVDFAYRDMQQTTRDANAILESTEFVNRNTNIA